MCLWGSWRKAGFCCDVLALNAVVFTLSGLLVFLLDWPHHLLPCSQWITEWPEDFCQPSLSNNWLGPAERCWSVFAKSSTSCSQIPPQRTRAFGSPRAALCPRLWKQRLFQGQSRPSLIIGVQMFFWRDAWIRGLLPRAHLRPAPSCWIYGWCPLHQLLPGGAEQNYPKDDRSACFPSDCFMVLWCWSRLVYTGSELVQTGLYWPELVQTGLYWLWMVQTGLYWLWTGPDWFMVDWCWSRLVYGGLVLVQTGIYWLWTGPDWFMVDWCWSRLVYTGSEQVQTGLYWLWTGPD